MIGWLKPATWMGWGRAVDRCNSGATNELAAFGLFAVTAMLVCYALEDHSAGSFSPLLVRMPRGHGLLAS
jgi:hypothetical protein